MTEGFLQTEDKLRRQSQELAVAWRRGRAAFVLDCLARQDGMRAALLAVLIHDLLARWDPIEGKRPVRFWRALVTRWEGWLTNEELQELNGEYQRRFGTSPPMASAARGSARDPRAIRQARQDQARQIREALEVGEPIPRASLPGARPVEFLRRRRAL